VGKGKGAEAVLCWRVVPFEVDQGCVIRSRKTFKRSGTMQMEMEMGGKLFFDLFVAMAQHIDELVDVQYKDTPRTV
jgi:hypothetical protein